MTTRSNLVAETPISARPAFLDSLGPTDKGKVIVEKRERPLRTRLHKWNRVIHRDLGYFFSGTVIIYAISGLAVNHIDVWDSNFVISREDIQLVAPMEKSSVTRESVSAILEPLGEVKHYRSHDFPSSNKVKIYLDDGSVFINLKEGKGVYETVKRRPFLYQANVLHLNPKKWWLVFSDMFAASLLIITISGLFILKGKMGITGRGAALGIVVPLFFLFTI